MIDLSSRKSSVLYTTIEKNIVNDIKEGYFQCRDFFTKHTNQEYEIFTKKKKDFFRILCTEFYEKYKDQHQLFPDIDIKTRIQRSQFVPIKYKNGGFEYPRSFTIYMDRVRDINVIPAKVPDFSEIDSFIEDFSTDSGFDAFFFGFFKRLRRLQIKLRKREVDVINLLTSIDFLVTDRDNNPRIVPVSYTDILNGLSLGEKQLKKIERAVNLIFGLKICHFSNIIMNMSKLGFYYLLVDTTTDNALLSNLGPFLYWDIDLGQNESKIFCVPFDNAEELLQNYDYVPLTHWGWNINTNSLKWNCENPWESFKLPNFNKKLQITEFTLWDLTKPSLWEYKPWEINVLKKISQSNNITVYNIDELSNERNPNLLKDLLKKLVNNHVFQYYPNLNFIGLDYKIGVRFSCKNKNVFGNFVNGLLSFPISHIYYNENLGEGLGYIHLPKPILALFLDSIDDLKEQFSEIRIEFSLNGLKTINRSLNLTEIDFHIKNGFAKLKGT